MKATETGPTVSCAKQNFEHIPGMGCSNCHGQCEKIIPIGYLFKQLITEYKKLETSKEANK